VARLAYVDFDGGDALAAAEGIDGELDEEFLRAWCARTVEAVERICGWVRGLG
jgi:aspartate aminotransferase